MDRIYRGHEPAAQHGMLRKFLAEAENHKRFNYLHAKHVIWIVKSPTFLDIDHPVRPNSWFAAK
jgi:hypothetical protein